MKVKALKAGFYAGTKRVEGEEFDVADGAKAKWFMSVSSAVIAKPKGRGKDKAPETFADVAKDDAAAVAPDGGGGDLV